MATQPHTPVSPQTSADSVASEPQTTPSTQVQTSVQTPAQKPSAKMLSQEDVNKLIEAAHKNTLQDGAVKVLNAILSFAYVSRASDVHLEPMPGKSIARIRIDGILHDMFALTTQLHAQVIAVLKITTRMRTDEHRAPQDGRFAFQVGTENIDVRASIIPITNGEKAVMRLLSGASHSLTLEQLGFSEDDYARVQRAIAKPWGMILATGPTGSGKTTTVYAVLEILNQREVNIATIEDPVEFDIEGVNQTQVDPAAKLTFANGLRSLVRQDPDIIMVGEIRDGETASIAVNAALTGHKLLSTIHTNNAASTMLRLMDMGIEPFLIASTMTVAIAQRLVRRVCEDCAQERTWTRKEALKVFSEELVQFGFEENDSVTIADAQGCETCSNTGYKGRLGIYEVLENSKEIQRLVIDRVDSDTLQQAAIQEGMTTITQDGMRKILSKQTTIEELMRVMRE